MKLLRTRTELENWCLRAKIQGVLVATNGCFDILHAGHISYLRKARSLGHFLLVGLNSDRSVRQLKGPTRPVNGQADRAEVIAALDMVDAVYIFNGRRATNFLRIVKPNIWVKGGDYTEDSLDKGEVKVVRHGGGEIKIIPLREGVSTTKVLKRLSRASVAQR